MARRDRVLLLAALLHLFCPASVSGFTLTTTSRLTNRPSSLPSTGLSQCLRPAAAEAAAASASTAPAGVKRQTVQMSFPVDLHGKVAFVAGVADSSGYGWAVAKNLASAGAKIVLGTWPPVLGIFKKSLESGRLDEDMKLPDGSKMKIEKIYALDAVYDTPDDVPEDVKKNKRYSAGGVGPFTLSEVASEVKKDFGKVDILVHSLANGPEVTKPLLETSRKGYLAAISASSYSMVSMLQRFGPIMSPGGAAVSLTYIASERVIPGSLRLCCYCHITTNVEYIFFLAFGLDDSPPSSVSLLLLRRALSCVFVVHCSIAMQNVKASVLLQAMAVE
eukprot:GHVS01064994.1.p1 GENE.GHVS01064994.1~~GHVS01064994.1.p1  ORF type:complete len:333 (-),score=66.23 GHVS01064994.1:521-1519(-)